MGISETIVAAMIGAIATVTTALFQLFTVLRNKGKVDARPKRGMTLRSVLAILALLVASAAGGFLYSEFMRQRAGEEMRAMRQELQELKELTARVASEKQAAPVASLALQGPADAELTPAAISAESTSVESVVYVPACRRSDPGAPCTEADAQRVALCGTIPSFARVTGIELYAQPDAVQNAWDLHRADLERDLGGARFTGKSFEYAQRADSKAVCVNFMHWSADHPHIARIIVTYRVGDPPPSQPTLVAPATAMATPAVIAAEAAAPLSRPAVFSETGAH